MSMQQPASQQTRWVTWPNLITMLRLVLLLPVCWLLLLPMPPGLELLPVVLLGIWASTDWIDGFLARRLHQVSRVGEVLDPVADRVGIAAVVVTLALSGLLPWWAVITTIAIDVVLVIVAGPAAKRGDLHVSRLGKVRTALVLLAVLILVIGRTADDLDADFGAAMVLIGKIIFGIGIAIQILAGVGYIRRAHPRRHRLRP
jgi:cardiolipin synthase